MAEPTKNISYTAADFERYHSGKMSEIEMNTLEKAALEDPFLADALEGYAYTKTPGKDIDELKEKLFSNQKNKKIFFINRKENVWLKIAASIILIAGMGYLAYYLNSPKQNHSLAKNEMQGDVRKTDEQVANNKMDSANDRNEKISPALMPEKKNDYALNKEANQNEINKEKQKINPQLNSIADDKIATSPANTDQSIFKKSITQEVKSKDDNKENETNLLKGKVEDTFGNAIGYVHIRGKKQQINTTTDADGTFKLLMKDSSLAATVAAPGYKTKDVMLRDKADQLIVIEADKKDLNEVAVSSMGMTKQKRAITTQEKLEGKVAGVTVNNSLPQQIAGEEKFDEYVRKNIKIPKKESGENYTGTVTLSFDVNKKGKPINIKVDQSLCADCDKEAIRLLEKSPKWKYIKERQVVSLQFYPCLN